MKFINNYINIFHNKYNIVSFGLCKWQVVSLFIFLGACVITRLYSVEGAISFVGHDIDAYLDPALGIVENGSFASYKTGVATTFSTPLYSLIIALGIFIGGPEFGMYFTIFLQCILLFITGILVSEIVGIRRPDLKVLSHYILIFNPNSFSAAHAIQTETVFTFLLVLSLFYLLNYFISNKINCLIFTALTLSLAAYVRPIGIYIAILLPFVFLIVEITKSGREGVRLSQLSTPFLRGLGALLIVLLCVAPWYARNKQQIGYYEFTTNKGLYLRDNLITLWAISFSESNTQATKRYNEKFNLYLERDKLFTEMDNPSIASKAHSSFVSSEILKVSSLNIVKAEIKSIALLYFSGGTGMFRDLWGIKGLGLHNIELNAGHSGVFDSVFSLLKQVNLLYIVLLGFGLVYSIALKLVGLVGVVSYYRSSYTKDGVIIVGLIMTLSASYMFLGQPRFRLPMEPLFTLLFIEGIAYARVLFISKYKKMMA